MGLSSARRSRRQPIRAARTTQASAAENEEELPIASESRKTQVGRGGSCRDPSLSAPLCGTRRETSGSVVGRWRRWRPKMVAASQGGGSEREKLFSREMCLKRCCNVGTVLRYFQIFGGGSRPFLIRCDRAVKRSGSSNTKFHFFSLARCFIGEKYELRVTVACCI